MLEGYIITGVACVCVPVYEVFAHSPGQTVSMSMSVYVVSMSEAGGTDGKRVWLKAQTLTF